MLKRLFAIVILFFSLINVVSPSPTSYYHVSAPVGGQRFSENDRCRQHVAASHTRDLVSAQEEHMRQVRNGTVDQRDILNGWDLALVKLGVLLTTGFRWLKNCIFADEPEPSFQRPVCVQSPPAQSHTSIELNVGQSNDLKARRITQAFENQKDLLVDYEESYIDMVYEESVERSSADQRIITRIQSMQASLRGAHTFEEKKYELKQETYVLLENYLPGTAADMRTLYGNELQQTLHRECIELFDIVAQHKELFEQQRLTEVFVYSTNAGHVYNRYGREIEAIEHIDLSWQLWQIVCGCADGVVLTAERAVGVVTHPIFQRL